MSHEIFVIETKKELDERDAGRVAYLRDKLQTAQNLGLDAQVRAIKVDLTTAERSLLIKTPPMTDAEVTIWQAWLPRAYTAEDPFYSLDRYNFDRIPMPVLKVWEAHKQSGIFERFEIWTPENNDPDPILVGVNGNARHLLARWGESDANLVSFDDIKQELVRRWYNNDKIGTEPHGQWVARYFRNVNALVMATFCAVLTFTFVGMGLANMLQSSVTGFSIGGAIALLCGATIFFYTRGKKLEKLLQSSNLMQAIAKDDAARRELSPTS